MRNGQVEYNVATRVSEITRQRCNVDEGCQSVGCDRQAHEPEQHCAAALDTTFLGFPQRPKHVGRNQHVGSCRRDVAQSLLVYTVSFACLQISKPRNPLSTRSAQQPRHLRGAPKQ